ncbi:hypothetical protein GJV26_00145 [Massilia dura]|uniref:Uncharacterized protein n=1 Tax=Pseudoduganella dura TaxID=321982 RepID=A0A6I3X3V7_9BURK|nr:hypothetical protein [Pseudoduganella dura]MUI10907.1 hypothetical protein [Pseudoduganella dura]GGY12855.1 hypothetical protein GCM10007386_49050 [Pseudoduganella dura]
MANGLLGKKAIPENMDTVVYTAPPGKVATVVINIFNRTKNTTIDPDVYVGTGVTDDDAFDGSPIQPRDVLERTQVPVSAGEKVTVRAPAIGLTVQVRGFEEDA